MLIIFRNVAWDLMHKTNHFLFSREQSKAMWISEWEARMGHQEAEK